jgi:histidinol-phosphatase (PHP family)
MIVDLHNHTPLCNHATGRPQEYIKSAIEKGTKVFGFSDHAPMDFDKAYRMNFSDMRKYETEILQLAQQYASEIKIVLGYEVDYLRGHMDERVLKADVDYLIGSVHFLEGWGFDNPEFLAKWQQQDVDEVWKNYFNTIEEMAQSRLFNIVGHLDLIKVFNYLPKGNITKIANRALDAIKENNMVIEINVAGFRKPVKEAYPSKELLEEAFKRDIPITFGSDAHQPSQVGLYENEVMHLVHAIGYRECYYFEKREPIKLSF